MSSRISRRSFLKGTALAAGVTILSGSLSARTYAQNAKVRFGNVGVGGRGGGHLGPASKENLAAICDTNEDTVNKVGDTYKDAKKFTDWRKMFDEMGGKIDAVFCATPDHSHFPVAYRALTMGKHCYCEKPLTHGIWESRVLADLAREKKLVTQMGNQGHANQGNRRIVEWIQAGVIGEVKEIHTWTNRPVWPQGLDRPAYTDPVPATRNWDVWLGVAPERPFADKWREGNEKVKGRPVYDGFSWRGWFDFGSGAVGDMGCHTFDCVWWAMDPVAPLSAEPIKVVDKTKEMFPRQMIVKWEFPKNAKRPGFTAFWYEGTLKPDVPEEIKNDAARTKKDLPNSGNLFIGTKGKLFVQGDYGDTPMLIPTATMEDFKKNMPPRMEASPGHHEEFIMACRGDKPWDFPKSNFMYGGPLCEAMLLGNVAMQLGKKIEWDYKALKCPGTPEADALIHRAYRKGFVNM